MQNILWFDRNRKGDYFSMYQVNIISKYSGTIKLPFAQNKSSVHVQLSDWRIIRNRGKWRASSYETELPPVRAGGEIVLEARRKGIRAEKERRFVHMYVYVLPTRYGYWIGLDCRVSSTNTQNLDVGRPLPFLFQTEITLSRPPRSTCHNI